MNAKYVLDVICSTLLEKPIDDITQKEKHEVLKALDSFIGVDSSEQEEIQRNDNE